MKLDTFAILSALDARARRGTADDAAGDNREAMAVLFQHFGLGPVPDLSIERRGGPTHLMYVHGYRWYNWTPQLGYYCLRTSSAGLPTSSAILDNYPRLTLLKIWHPR